MNFNLMHPAEQIVMLLSRVYQKGLTTTSGGNLSVKDSEGVIWITPSGIDKGSLTAAEICFPSINLLIILFLCIGFFNCFCDFIGCSAGIDATRSRYA